MALFALHYHELGLKGGNRTRFERVLEGNCQKALARWGTVKTQRIHRRILVSVDGPVDEVFQRLTEISGIAYVMRAQRFPVDLDAVAKAVADDLNARSGLETFRITTKRGDKSYPMISTQIDRAVGGPVQDATGLGVRMKGADAEVRLSVLKDQIIVGLERRDGPGGLPAGTAGRVAVLMSGGFDSPVAAWRMINRGCTTDLIHFHSHPLVDKTTQEKARDLAEVLTAWQFRTRLLLVPLAAVQTEVRLQCPAPLRVILYRRFMVRIAERLARMRNALALVTGESVGQVASQTLENLATVDAVATMPVLRPLIGTDKQEIIAISEKLKTFDISARKDQDCCQLFVPPRPATRSTPEEAAAAEEALDVEGLVEDAVAGTEVVSFP
ncbi:MAG: tRNA 4-thiouridine(8) synthase ThiI [Planctomycetota bacterium]|nr:tRNA 4-thiouridine(8) synthase ThiI [Planctomycetota bacterium]